MVSKVQWNKLTKPDETKTGTGNFSFSNELSSQSHKKYALAKKRKVSHTSNEFLGKTIN